MLTKIIIMKNKKPNNKIFVVYLNIKKIDIILI